MNRRLRWLDPGKLTLPEERPAIGDSKACKLKPEAMPPGWKGGEDRRLICSRPKGHEGDHILHRHWLGGGLGEAETNITYRWNYDGACWEIEE